MSYFQNKIEAMIVPLLERTDENIAEVKVSLWLFVLQVLSKVKKASFLCSRNVTSVACHCETGIKSNRAIFIMT